MGDEKFIRKKLLRAGADKRPVGVYDWSDDHMAYIGVIAEVKGKTVHILTVEKLPTKSEIIAWIAKAIATREWETRQ